MKTIVATKKDRMFQCTIGNSWGIDILEDTGLITRNQAYELWDKYFDQIKKALVDNNGGDMVIWKDCDSNTDYNIEEKVIDHEYCIVEYGHIYRIKKTEIL